MNKEEEILAFLELPSNLFNLIVKDKGIYLAEKGLNEVKDIIRKQRKVLAKKYHPDLETGNKEKMQKINNLIDQILDLKIIVKQRPRPIVYHTFRFYNNFTATSATTSFTSTSGSGV